MEHYPTSDRITYGKRIPPIKMIETFSSEEWEEFIEEWLDLKKSLYHSIENFGGAGDKGRDVAAYIDDPKSKLDYRWDCYQCKHYDNALVPSEVYVEFGKIIYYTFIKEYPVPQKYYFVSPKDCGTSLSKLLINPNNLKEKIRENWNDKCKNLITQKNDIPLEGALLQYFESFDFSIFDKILRKVIIEEHTKHPNHLIRFGGSLPDRPKLKSEEIPSEIQPNEIIYIENLLEAYNSTKQVSYTKANEIKDKYLIHFVKAREGFHFAEQLRVLYRDNLPQNTFEEFQEEIYNGISNSLLGQYADGFEKVKSVEDQSQVIQITSNPLKEVSKPQDRIGICHQLSNNGTLKWNV